MLKVLVLFCLIFVMADTNTESSEETHAYTYNSFYAPSTLNFNDIYANNIVGTAPDEEASTTDVNLNTDQVLTQFVEFHPDSMTQPPTTVPPPKYILNATYLKESTTKSTTTTEDPDEVRVMPVRRRGEYQRGVLDLLFPSARVKSFKNIFDSIRGMLSYTFRRR